MPKPIASLSLDLDNRWAYLRTHGVEGWQSYPSYLPTVCDRIGAVLSEFDLDITLFVVGKDLEDEANREAVAGLAAEGHEIANHSYWHYPWLDQLEPELLEQEIADTEIAIEALTGVRPVGFRAPGFSGSPEVLSVLASRGYRYDASTFPTIIGPLAAWYARLKSFGRHQDGRQRFASLRDGFATLAPHVVSTPAGTLVEVPVTTMPVFRLPIHVTYLMYLHQFSRMAAYAYLRTSISLCRMRGVAPSLLLHPLDFLGGEEEPLLSFFPGMKVDQRSKLSLLRTLFESMQQHFDVGPLARHAATAADALPAEITPVSIADQV
ncbi:polysaccharide deacetylase family protein [Aeoliella mucimassa]|uniref:Peptidoglycan-N-acetylglucosamine deacetylase n=1 Tax=Aeoliella mucimassa TaxID=2527972 RepID=A0A518AN11_9BACT|nr:polysaccharide deacetylase family protein [Aeoliella mucimassa]QDU56086.1 Peptidoglycan-N-acetylglucosamine deacetylase [Aeoliella mucimassa]